MRKTLPAIASPWAGLLAVFLGSQVCSGERSLEIVVSAESVGRYEKVEFDLRFDAQYRNPFDPDEVDLSILLKTPGGKRLRVPAFYLQDYQRQDIAQGRRNRVWMYPAGKPVWKARFAPEELGDYEAMAVLKDADGTARSAAVRFECKASLRKGFLRVSKQDPRFFELSDGRPFFAIGQNLAFIGQGQYVDLAKAEEIFAKLSENGVNYLRIWTCCKDWAMAVEARKSAWGRSWSWRPPIVPDPGVEGTDAVRKCVKMPQRDGSTLKPQPSHAVALRPETQYVFSCRVKTAAGAAVQCTVNGASLNVPVSSGADGGWVPLELSFETGPAEFWLGDITFRKQGSGKAWLDGLSLKEAAGGPELFWEAAVNRPVRGYYNPVDCFMLDQIVDAAQKHGIYLQLCLITRDLYMDALRDDRSAEYQQATGDAKKLLRYAVARWGYSTSVAAWEHFNENDPNLPTDRFYTETGRYLRQIDPYGHLRSTSTWHPSPKDCRHGELDLADVHFYLRPVEKKRLRDEVEAVVDRARYLRQHAPAKPALIGEFGLANDKWTPTEEMKTSDQLVDFHNALWASALSGTSGVALYWWWDRLDRRNVYPHYRPLAAFVDDVPWTTARLSPSSATVSNERVRLVGLQGRDRAYLWLFNPQAAWASVVVQRKTPTEIHGVTLRVDDLAAGEYRVRWWDTRSGKVLRRQTLSASDGTLTLDVPTFDRDVACKITP